MNSNPPTTDPSAPDEYDFIVVGGGSAGCIVAARLSALPHLRVLLLEAGDPAEGRPEALQADQYKMAFIHPQMMWDRYSVPQSGAGNKRLFVGSGRGMGGSGSVNAMVYTRGAAFDWDSWNVDGWRWQEMQEDFRSLEETLRVERIPGTRFTEACIAAAEESGFTRKDDFNDGALSGYLGYEWMNASPSDNVRRSSYVAFLRPFLDRPNLRIVTRATARRVLLHEARATGVEYEHDGRTVTARAKNEVILCAGALETPRLLLLSGVGPAADLRALDIHVHCDVPNVGKNLMDHPNVQLFFKGAGPSDSHWAQLYGFHRANPASPLPGGEADTCYVFYSARTSFREGAIRLLPGMILPPLLYRRAWLVAALRGLLSVVFGLGPVRRFVERMWGVVVILGKPESRGTVRLASANPAEPALVDPGYFTAPRDIDAMVKGVELARRVASGRALKEWGNQPLIPPARIKTDKQVERFIRQNAITTYHYSGTCRMGVDAESVVDPRLRLRGIAGLRIADASIVPSVPVSAMNAPSMVIACRAARFILEDQATAARTSR